MELRSTQIHSRKDLQIDTKVMISWDRDRLPSLSARFQAGGPGASPWKSQSQPSLPWTKPKERGKVTGRRGRMCSWIRRSRAATSADSIWRQARELWAGDFAVVATDRGAALAQNVAEDFAHNLLGVKMRLGDLPSCLAMQPIVNVDGLKGINGLL